MHLDSRTLAGRVGRCERNECSIEGLKAWPLEAASAARLSTSTDGRVLVGRALRAERCWCSVKGLDAYLSQAASDARLSTSIDGLVGSV